MSSAPNPDSAETTQPNVILITTDQQRYDTLGVTGNPRVQTPAMDALAGRGAQFRRAYIQNPVCVPSRACIQTGRYVHQHGVDYMSSAIDQTPGLPPWETTVMERLQDAGYSTAAFGKIHMMPPRGFDEMQLTMGKGARWTSATGSPLGPAQLGPTYEEWLEQRNPGGYESIYAQRRMPEYTSQATAITNVLPADQYVDSWIGENAVEYVERDHDRPFFLWTGFCGPHTPFDPPEPYASMYDQASIPIPELAAATSPTLLMSPRSPAFDGPDGESVMRRMIAYYWAMMTLIDDMVAKIVAAADRQRDKRDTLIIVTTDHGEMLGDFGAMGKANFTEQVIRVPCLIAPPGDRDSGGTTVDDLVEHVDLAPTILDYAGVEQPRELPGRSLRPYLEPGHTTPEPRESALCEFTTNDRQQHSKCLRTERYKYVFNGNDQPAEFYDLAEDPNELVNLAGDSRYAARVRDHAELLLDRLTTTNTSAWNSTSAARAPSTVDDFGRPTSS